MNKIVCALFAFLFAQMANGLNSAECTAALNASSTCVSGLSNSSILVCSGMCQSELVSVATACENSVSLTASITAAS